MNPITNFGRSKAWFYWGKRGGSIDKFSGSKVIKLRRGGSTSGNNSGSVPRTWQSILASNAIAKGWLNGKQIRKVGH